MFGKKLVATKPCAGTDLKYIIRRNTFISVLHLKEKLPAHILFLLAFPTLLFLSICLSLEDFQAHFLRFTPVIFYPF